MNELISYAGDFASFFIMKSENLNKINSIILFGSVARDEAGKESDVDIFIDVVGNEKKIDAEVKKTKKQFFDSIKFQKNWKLLNITNDINIIVGQINKWKLKDSISGEAIVLYGKYSPITKGKANIVMFFWENIKPNSKRVSFNKKIFGYKHKGKFYPGLLNKYNGEKLNKGTIIFDLKYSQDVLKTFRKYKIPVKIMKILKWE